VACTSLISAHGSYELTIHHGSVCFLSSTLSATVSFTVAAHYAHGSLLARRLLYAAAGFTLSVAPFTAVFSKSC
jgi:hypothetical protein